MESPKPEFQTGDGGLETIVDLVSAELRVVPDDPYSLVERAVYDAQYRAGMLAGSLFVQLEYAKTAQEHAVTRAEDAESKNKIDLMTGLFNREHLMKRYEELQEQEIVKGKRKSDLEPLGHSLAVIDADRFKSVNDTYGHVVGDKVLVRLAQILKHSVKRPTDVVARIGGEEFGILLPGANLVEAATMMESVRRDVVSDPELVEILRGAAHDIGQDEWQGMSISIGVTKLRLKESYRTNFSNADKNLLKAKRAGRNQVIAV